MILHNARVFTTDPTQPSAEAFAVLHGLIASAGASREPLKTAGANTRLADLQGVIVRDDSGEAAGALKESAQGPVRRLIPKPGHENIANPGREHTRSLRGSAGTRTRGAGLHRRRVGKRGRGK